MNASVFKGAAKWMGVLAAFTWIFHCQLTLDLLAPGAHDGRHTPFKTVFTFLIVSRVQKVKWPSGQWRRVTPVLDTASCGFVFPLFNLSPLLRLSVASSCSMPCNFVSLMITLSSVKP